MARCSKLWKESNDFIFNVSYPYKRKNCSVMRSTQCRRGTTTRRASFAGRRMSTTLDINRMWSVSVSPAIRYIPVAPRFPLTSAITLCTAALQSPRHPRIDCLSDWKVSQHDFPYEIPRCTLPCATSTHSHRHRLPRFSSYEWKIDHDNGFFFRQFPYWLISNFTSFFNPVHLHLSFHIFISLVIISTCNHLIIYDKNNYVP